MVVLEFKLVRGQANRFRGHFESGQFCSFFRRVWRHGNCYRTGSGIIFIYAVDGADNSNNKKYLLWWDVRGNKSISESAFFLVALIISFLEWGIARNIINHLRRLLAPTRFSSLICHMTVICFDETVAPSSENVIASLVLSLRCSRDKIYLPIP